MRFFSQTDATASPEPNDCDSDRRADRDRRQTPTGPWSAFPPAGGRMASRRAQEHRQPYFVDRFSSAMFIAVVLLIVASVVDAVLTIQLIDAGAVETNPLMAHLLDHGILPFVIGKYVLTVAGLPLLLIFKNYYLFDTRVRVGHLIPMALVTYLALIGYQLALMHSYTGPQKREKRAQGIAACARDCNPSESCTAVRLAIPSRR
jgi:hypothetical protein